MSAVSLVKRGNWGGMLTAAVMAFVDAEQGYADPPPGFRSLRAVKLTATGEHFVTPPTIATAEDGDDECIDAWLAYLFDDSTEMNCYVGRITGSVLTEFETDSGAGPFPTFGQVNVNGKGHAATRSGSNGNFLAVELTASLSNPGKLDVIPRSGPYAAMSDRISISVNGTIAFAAGAGKFGGFTTLYQGSSGTTVTPIVDISGMFDTLYGPTINKSNEMVFPGFEDDNTAGFYKFTGGMTWTLADSNHGYPAFGNGTLNDSGSTAFRAIETATGKEQIKLALNGSVELTTVGPLGEYDALGDPSINNRNEVAVETHKGSNRTIYYQPTAGFRINTPPPIAPTNAEAKTALAELPTPAPVVVVKTGDALSGSTVTDLTLSSQALTDDGHLAFHAKLADGREGVYVATPKRSALLNIATRLRVLAGENVLIAGFIVTGADPKKVIIRGIGPSLTGLGVPGALTDPVLELHQGAATLDTNDNWKIKASNGSSQQAEIEATTIPPSNDAEAALVATLAPGNYTAILSGKSAETGIGLIEVYDLDQTSNAQAVNISTRGFVDTGDNVMIGGIIAGPVDAVSSRILIRALGPSLANAGVGNPLANPFLELHDSSGATLFTNDDWKKFPDGTSQQADIEATTIPPTNDLESAIVGALPPGNYTAIVRGTGNSSGVSLVEVYNLK